MSAANLVGFTSINYLGIIKGLLDETGIIDTIDTCIGHNKRKISVGTAVAAMIMNGLGLNGRALYLTPKFFSEMPTDVLFGEGIKPEDFNDDCLGSALDALYAAGITEIFYQVASQALAKMGITHNFVHLDSTSFSLHGKYIDKDAEPGESQPEVVRITKGFSKDGAPELNQVVLQMICSQRSTLPVWIEVLSGNSSDKASFRKTVTAFKKQIDGGAMPVIVADSALYSNDGLHELKDVSWITRVPETIKEAKQLIEQLDHTHLLPICEGYRALSIPSTWGGISQRWLVVHSELAAQREMKTFEKRLQKTTVELEREAWHLGVREFACEADAHAEAVKFIKRLKLHSYAYVVNEKKCYSKPGKPKKNAIPDKSVWSIQGTLSADEERINIATARKGFFIIASNVLDANRLPASEMLSVYKAQGVSVERGFRFLKDPMFYAESLYLNSPRRIMALIMVMTLSLLVYSLAEKKLRKALKEKQLCIKSQVDKDTDNPTLRWVFQIFTYVQLGIVELEDGTRQYVSRPKTDQITILTALGELYRKYYFLS
jgi:transposase